MLTPIPLTSPNKLSLVRLDSIVAARLGETRVSGNAHPAVLNRQVAMYLAKQIGGWSYEAIGRFYNGRHHSTVHYAIRRVEALREHSPDLDTLLCDLRQAIADASDELSPQQKSADLQRKSRKVVALAKNEVMLEALAERVALKLRPELMQILSFVQRSVQRIPAEGLNHEARLRVLDLTEGLVLPGREEP